MQAVSFLINQADIVRINAVFKKAHRWGLTTKLLRFEDLATQADTKLFRALKTKTIVYINYYLVNGIHTL